MKNDLRMLLLILFLTKGIDVNAQTYDFPVVYSPTTCAYTYAVDITLRLDSVGITNVYFDDGTTGSFAFEAYVSYENTVTNSTLPPGNFYTYDIAVYSDNPNLSSPSLTNNAGSVPLVTSSAGGIGSQNNPTYIGSASAMGLSQGQYYSSPSLLAQLGYDNATIHIGLPCMDTVLLADSTIPLPVLWSSLSAKITEHTVFLNWQTFMEQNNQGFYIERSIDAKNWNTVDKVSSKAKDGNSSTPISYSFKTKEVISGTYYYRIVQETFNGRVIKSNVVSANIRNQSNIIAYPNPAGEELYIDGIDEQSEFTISNLLGIVVLKGNYNKKIITSGLFPGVYWIRCEGRNIKVAIYSTLH